LLDPPLNFKNCMVVPQNRKRPEVGLNMLEESVSWGGGGQVGIKILKISDLPCFPTLPRRESATRGLDSRPFRSTQIDFLVDDRLLHCGTPGVWCTACTRQILDAIDVAEQLSSCEDGLDLRYTILSYLGRAHCRPMQLLPNQILHIYTPLKEAIIPTNRGSLVQLSYSSERKNKRERTWYPRICASKTSPQYHGAVAVFWQPCEKHEASVPIC
jgi:hypothetical protein